MANCCTETPCNKLVTVGDLNSIISAVHLDACTNYVSGGSKSFGGCCSGAFSGYSPTYVELTANSQSNMVRFQNWSGQTNDDWYNDRDGFIVNDPQWSSSCCAGDTNVPISNIGFEFTTYSGFSASNVTINECEESGVSTFNYGMTRKRFNWSAGTDCSILSSSTIDSIILDNSYVGNWGDIISAISVTSSSTPSTYTPFSSFSEETVNNVKITSQNIFNPILVNKDSAQSGGGDCDGVSAITVSADTWVHIIPKFRGCPKENVSYHVYKDGGEAIQIKFGEYYYNCSDSIANYESFWIYKFISYETTNQSASVSSVAESLSSMLSGNVSYVDLENPEQEPSEIYDLNFEISSYSTYSTIKAYVTINGENIYFFELIITNYQNETPYSGDLYIYENNQEYDLRFDICINLRNCNSVSSCCSFCQSRKQPADDGICCSGLFSQYPSVSCGASISEDDN